MSETLFKYSDLEMFFEKYISQLTTRYGYCYSDDLQAWLEAFKYYIETRIDVMPEYQEIQKIISRYKDYLQYISYQHMNSYAADRLKEMIDELNYLVEYNGIWNMQEILLSHRLTKESLLADISMIQHDFPVHTAIEEDRKKKEQEEYIKTYYEKNNSLSESEINSYFKDHILIDSNKIDVTNVSYPVLLFLHEKGRVLSIHKVSKELDHFISHQKQHKNFDRYSYVLVNENYIDDVYAEAIIKVNPIFAASYGLTLKNSIYRTLNQIKKRYKGIKGINLWTIKKVISLYEIPIFNLNNGSQVVNRDRFDTAIKEYMGSDLNFDT